LLLATSNGYGFAASLGDMVSRQKAGKQFITVEEGAEPLRPQLVSATSDRLIACLSARGRVLVFDAAEIKALAGGGRGVTLMDSMMARRCSRRCRSAAEQCCTPTRGSAGKPG